MWPIILSINHWVIYTLGLFLVVAFFVAGFIIWRRLIDLGYQEDRVIDGILLGGVMALLVGRLIYLLGSQPIKYFNPGSLLNWNKVGGFSGAGIIVALLIIILFLWRKRGVDTWRVADEISFGILPLLLIIEVGLFFDGSVIGLPTDKPWGLYVPGEMVKRQPVSLYYIIGYTLIWLVLLKIERWWRGWDWYKSHASGFIFWGSMAMIFLLDIALAFTKDSRLYFLIVNLVVSGLAGLGAIIIWLIRSGRYKK